MSTKPRSCSRASASRFRKVPSRSARTKRFYAATELGGSFWAVKAQIHAGARGKAGGIKLCRTINDVRDAAKDLLGKRPRHDQTGPEGKPVQRVYVETADPFERELYLGYVLDRKAERVRVIASQRGGMEIEQIAAEEPEALIQVVVEPAVGLQQFQAREIAFKLGLNIKQVAAAVKTIMNAYRAFRDCDGTMLEINPLGRHQGRPGAGARCQDVLRRQRLVPSPDHHGHARPLAGRTRARPRPPSTTSATLASKARSAASSTVRAWPWQPWT